MNKSNLQAFTTTYVKTVEKAWSLIRVNEADVLISDIYFPIQVTQHQLRSILEPQRMDIVGLPERIEHTSIGESQDFFSREEESISNKITPLNQLLSTANHFALLGEPGSGKSLTLQYIGYCLAHEDWAKTHLNIHEKFIPVRLDLRYFSKLIKAQGMSLSLESALANAVNNFIRLENRDDALKLVIYWRDDSRLFVILDGLDEIPDDMRSFIQEEINNFAISAPGENCKIIVSSRLAGYNPLSKSFAEYDIKPFEKSQEILSFLENWLAVFMPEINHNSIAQKAELLLEQMKSQKSLQHVLDNPLFLRLVIEVFSKKGTIARSRADLYSQYFQEISARSYVKKPDQDFQNTDLSWQLEEFAWQIQSNTKIITDRELLSNAREKLGILVQVGDQIIFSHRTFQEYFVALRLVRAWKTNKKTTWNFLKHRLHISIWKEPILLLGGLLDDNDLNSFMLMILGASSAHENILYRDIELAASLVEENPIVCQWLCKISDELAVVAGTAIFFKLRLRTTA